MKHRASLQHCAYNQAMKEHLHEMHLVSIDYKKKKKIHARTSI